ncbi:hypothetical protein DH2020_027897 [Rehmannia glutinosa]|uniref:Non-structural maintenance of chromosome element 4 C-terminal domain-containing protein n=1 Tax=Rehmannia glutinosa TaxID=99300 RepID=A0ABR0VSX0_REHGL
MERKLKRERVADNGGDSDSVVVEETDELNQENDPVSKRRDIRSHYREIENRINEGKDEIANGDSDKFMAIMNEVENMHQHVKKPREQIADAEALLGLTRHLTASVKTHTSGDITPAEFVSCLIREFGRRKIAKHSSENSPNISWRNIGFLVSPIFLKVPGCMTMIGPIENKLKQRKVAVRAKRSRSIRKAQPKELEKAAEVVTDTDKNMQVMFEILKKEKKVKAENLMLNRNSFAQTVENLFALSFLVKDGRVRIVVDETGSEVVVPTNGPTAEEIKSGVAKSHQFIFRFDFDDWKLMKTQVPEGEELMPQRDAFTNSCYDNANTQPCDQDLSIPEGIPIDSCLILTAPVKKFSKNYGRTMLNSCLTQVDGGMTGNWSCKRKRSVMPKAVASLASLKDRAWVSSMLHKEYSTSYIPTTIFPGKTSDFPANIPIRTCSFTVTGDGNYPGATSSVSRQIQEKGTETQKIQDVEPVIIDNFANCTKKKCLGGWSSAFLLLVNQGLATLGFFGVGVNLVLFLTRVLGQDNASAANNISKWTGTVYLCSLVGAFLSDSYWGRYLTCAIFQVIFILGLALVSLTSWLFMLNPSGCGDGKLTCEPTAQYASVLFYLAIYLVAFGYGGHQPTLATFGSDQFDESNPKQKFAKTIFFSYFYFALNVGSLFSNTVLVYYEDDGKWTLGFWAATASAVLALVTFLLGSRGYRYIKPCGNPITRVLQVFVAAFKKWNIRLRDGGELYEIEGIASAIKGARKICHTDELVAAIITEKDRIGPTTAWHLCTVTQVEEAKCIIRMMPIWLCTIIYSVVFTQMASLFVEQGDVMDTRIGKFRIPAASMSAFNITSVLIWTGIYRHIIVPISAKLSGNPKGLTELQRMGIGLLIALLGMIAAGVTEIERLKRVVPGHHASSLSILWQIPQFFLVGASEVFMYVGQLDFFNGQAPDGIKSFGSSLCMASMSLGNFASTGLVNLVMVATARNGAPGWIPLDLNKGHIDRFYFLLGGLTAVDFFVYLACAKWYKTREGEDDEKVVENLDMEFGGAKKRGRPEGVLNGNGGFKKSKQGL